MGKIPTQKSQIVDAIFHCLSSKMTGDQSQYVCASTEHLSIPDTSSDLKYILMSQLPSELRHITQA